MVYSVSGTPPSAETTRLLSLAIATANTEYSLHLGLTKSLKIGCREGDASLRTALVSGKVAGSVEPFHVVAPKAKLDLTFAPAEDVTIYVASPVANIVTEIVCR